MDRNAILARIKDWTSLEITSEQLDDLVFALAMDEDLEDAMKKAVKETREEYVKNAEASLVP